MNQGVYDDLGVYTSFWQAARSSFDPRANKNAYLPFDKSQYARMHETQNKILAKIFDGNAIVDTDTDFVLLPLQPVVKTVNDYLAYSRLNDREHGLPAPITESPFDGVRALILGDYDSHPRDADQVEAAAGKLAGLFEQAVWNYEKTENAILSRTIPLRRHDGNTGVYGSGALRGMLLQPPRSLTEMSDRDFFKGVPYKAASRTRAKPKAKPKPVRKAVKKPAAKKPAKKPTKKPA